MEKLANNIVKLRVMNGLSQDDLAGKVGVTRQTIHKWEKGIACPKGDNLDTLCKELDVSMDQLLGKKPLILEKKIELAIDELKTDLKEEDAKARKMRNKALIIKLLKCIITIIVILVVTYACYTTYKFIVLTNIGKEVSKYENLDNYYCEIKTYQDDKLQQKKTIWYKDPIYKIQDIDFNDVGKIIGNTVTIISLNDDFKTVYDKDTNNSKKIELNDKERYLKGNYMYNLFPDIIKNSTKIKIETSFGLNTLELNNNQNTNIFNLKINNVQVEFDKNSYIPVCYIDGDKRVNYKQNFIVKLNEVNDDDLNV